MLLFTMKTIVLQTGQTLGCFISLDAWLDRWLDDGWMSGEEGDWKRGGIGPKSGHWCTQTWRQEGVMRV